LLRIGKAAYRTPKPDRSTRHQLIEFQLIHLKSSDVIATSIEQGQEAEPGPPEMLGDIHQTGIEQWRDSIVKAGSR
jgi:hypothetical protein